MISVNSWTTQVRRLLQASSAVVASIVEDSVGAIQLPIQTDLPWRVLLKLLAMNLGRLHVVAAVAMILVLVVDRAVPVPVIHLTTATP